MTPAINLSIGFDPALGNLIFAGIIVVAVVAAVMLASLAIIIHTLRCNNSLLDKSNALLDEIADLLCAEPDDKDRRDIPAPESNVISWPAASCRRNHP